MNFCASRRLFRSEMRFKAMRLSLVMMCLSYVAMISSLFNASAQQLLPDPLVHPWKQEVYAGSFGRGMSYPALANGYLLSYSHKQTKLGQTASQVTFRMTSLTTGTVATLSLSLPASDVMIDDAEPGPGGSLVVAGVYAAQDTSKPTSFITSIVAGGSGGYLLTLGTFHPDRVCVSPNGTTWVLGHDPNREATRPQTDYDMMLSFSSAGAQIGHYLPRSTFSSTEPLTFAKGNSGMTAMLDCNTATAGAYMAIHGEATWTEVSVGTEKATSVPVFTAGRVRMTGLVFKGPRDVYASMISGGTPSLYKLTIRQFAQSGEWERVDTEGNFARLLGKDNGSLVYFNSDADHLSPRLLWSRP